MKRIETWAVLVLGGACVAVYDLVSGWLVAADARAWIASLGLFVLAWVLFALAFAAAVSSTRRARAEGGSGVPATGARGAGWASAFAIGFAVLLFANCGSAISTTTPGHVGVGAMSDAHTYWSLAPWLLGPLLIALAIPGVLATVAASTHGRRWANAAVVAAILAPVVALLSVPVGFVFGVSNCDVGTVGGCAAGVGSLANIFSVASLALFLPYVLLLLPSRQREGAGLSVEPPT